MIDKSVQKQIFQTWLEKHKGILYKIVRVYAFTPADQEDLFQEISLQLWQSIPSFRGEAKASTWIYRVALYTAYLWVRTEKKLPETEPLEAIDQTWLLKAEPIDAQLGWLYEQIAQLDPLDRSVCLLLLDGFKYKEIAAMLSLSESNVGAKIHRIKQHLTRRAKENDYHVV